MKYLMVNKTYGTTVVAPSDKARDNILQNSKKGKDGQILWSVLRELGAEDVVVEFDPVAERERIRAELLAELNVLDTPKEPVRRKPGPKPKVKTEAVTGE